MKSLALDIAEPRRFNIAGAALYPDPDCRPAVRQIYRFERFSSIMRLT
jgi:hypothetical protein